MIVGMEVYANFYNAGAQILKYEAKDKLGESVGGHAVTLVGWGTDENG